MPADLPYMNSVRNVPAILDKIQVAGTPPRFTHDFLSNTLGFSSSSDRGVINVFKKLGLLSTDGTPTERYNAFRTEGAKSAAIASGLKEGWQDVFLADERAHERSYAAQTEMFKNVTGKGEAVAKKMASTFRAFADRADWSASPATDTDSMDDADLLQEMTNGEPKTEGGPAFSLHHDIHIHLPPSADVAVYTAIFRALREELRD